jgi:hypothetical protein
MLEFLGWLRIDSYAELLMLLGAGRFLTGPSRFVVGCLQIQLEMELPWAKRFKRLLVELKLTDHWQDLKKVNTDPENNLKKWKQVVKTVIINRERTHWASNLKIPLPEVNTVPSTLKVTTLGEGIKAHHSFFLRYDYVAHYLRHKGLSHYHKNCPLCLYPRDSPKHRLVCTATEAPIEVITTILKHQATIQRIWEKVKIPISIVDPTRDQFDIAQDDFVLEDRRLLVLTGTKVDLTYSDATYLQRSIASLRRIHCQFSKDYREKHPVIYEGSGKKRLNCLQRERRINEIFASSTYAEAKSLRNILLNEWSKTQIDRWIKTMVVEKKLAHNWKQFSESLPGRTYTKHSKLSSTILEVFESKDTDERDKRVEDLQK